MPAVDGSKRGNVSPIALVYPEGGPKGGSALGTGSAVMALDGAWKGGRACGSGLVILGGGFFEGEPLDIETKGPSVGKLPAPYVVGCPETRE